MFYGKESVATQFAPVLKSREEEYEYEENE